MSKHKRARTLVVASLGAMQQALCATLGALPWLELVGAAGGGLSALMLAGERRPDLMVIDGNLSADEVIALVRRIKQDLPAMRCLVLATTQRQHRAVMEAGADGAVLYGCAFEEVQAALETIGRPAHDLGPQACFRKTRWEIAGQ